jgi:hypothetical protein
MNNGDVCDYVRRTIDPHKNKYIADSCVKEGYGQSCGGYLKDCNKKYISQKEHFLNYYDDKAEKPPTYAYLRCPQLLLFIAEIAGVSRKNLEKAYEIVKNYEDANKLKDDEKNGNYMWGKPAFRELKSEIHISDVVRIIKEVKNWDVVRERTMKLK